MRGRMRVTRQVYSQADLRRQQRDFSLERPFLEAFRAVESLVTPHKAEIASDEVGAAAALLLFLEPHPVAQSRAEVALGLLDHWLASPGSAESILGSRQYAQRL